jgi:hypothetical protein
MPKTAAGFWQLVVSSLYILLVLSLFVEHQYVIRKKKTDGKELAYSCRIRPSARSQQPEARITGSD